MKHPFVLLLLLTAATSCTSNRKQIKRVMREMPEGGITLLQCADQAARTYHLISETNAQELETPEVTNKVNDMLTRSRDLYRRTKSYGRLLPDNEHVVSSDDLEEIRGDISEYGYELELAIRRSKEDWGIEVRTLRGKLICVLGARGQSALFVEPFLSIVEGDIGRRIEPIPDRVRGK